MRGGSQAHEGGVEDHDAVRLCRSLSAAPRVATPWPVRRPADPRGHRHMVARVCTALAPVCRSLSATPLRRLPPRYNGDGLGTVGLPQIRPSAATMCFGTSSSDALRVPGPARRVCSSRATSLHAARRPAES